MLGMAGVPHKVAGDVGTRTEPAFVGGRWQDGGAVVP